MKLGELEAKFVGDYQSAAADGRLAPMVSYRELPSVDGAQGVLFVCPKCQNHSVLAWFLNPRNAPAVPPDAFPRPGRWTFTGETIETLTLTPSVDLSKIDADHSESPSRCYWHGWVKDGNAE